MKTPLISICIFLAALLAVILFAKWPIPQSSGMVDEYRVNATTTELSSYYSTAVQLSIRGEYTPNPSYTPRVIRILSTATTVFWLTPPYHAPAIELTPRPTVVNELQATAVEVTPRPIVVSELQVTATAIVEAYLTQNARTPLRMPTTTPTAPPSPTLDPNMTLPVLHIYPDALFPIPEGFENMCAELLSGWFWEPGDEAGTLSARLGRSHITIDNTITLPAVGAIDDLLLVWVYDDARNYLGSYGGRITPCFLTNELLTGNHTAVMEISTRSGRTYIFSWEFVIENRN